jgi:hypothetical protein
MSADVPLPRCVHPQPSSCADRSGHACKLSGRSTHRSTDPPPPAVPRAGTPSTPGGCRHCRVRQSNATDAERATPSAWRAEARWQAEAVVLARVWATGRELGRVHNRHATPTAMRGLSRPGRSAVLLLVLVSLVVVTSRDARSSAAAPQVNALARLIVFVTHCPPDVGCAIWTVTPDGSALRRLTPDTPKRDHPAWSPDGRKIAY